MPTIERFEEIEAWKIARELTNDVYRMTKDGLFARDYALRNQICRSSVSVMSNIAEGFERDGNKEFVNFLSIAKGSAGEVRSHLYVALDQDYINKEQFAYVYRKADQNGKVIAGLMHYLRKSEFRGGKYK